MSHSTIHAGYVAPGSIFAAVLRHRLRDLAYNISAVESIVGHVDVEGTARGSCADVEDVQAINALVVKHWSHVESDPADWPAAFDDDVWNLTPAEPPAGPLPSETNLAPDYEPSHADRAYWAMTTEAEARLDRAVDQLADEARATELVVRGLTPFTLAPIAGGAPSPDERPVKVRPWDDQDGTRSRPQRHLTDFDHLTAHGCV